MLNVIMLIFNDVPLGLTELHFVNKEVYCISPSLAVSVFCLMSQKHNYGKTAMAASLIGLINRSDCAQIGWVALGSAGLAGLIITPQ